jgi:hypothetical protein
MQKTSCRILVGTACNYSCAYCCNKLPGMLDRFQKVTLDQIDLSPYRDVCISGGEPLWYKNIPTTTAVLTKAKTLDKNVFVYTNLSILPPFMFIQHFAGWNVGFHPTQISDIGEFVYRLDYLLRSGAKGIRVQVEDVEVNKLIDLIDPDLIKVWTRDNCDKTPIEDWFLLKE